MILYHSSADASFVRLNDRPAMLGNMLISLTKKSTLKLRVLHLDREQVTNGGECRYRYSFYDEYV